MAEERNNLIEEIERMLHALSLEQLRSVLIFTSRKL